MDPQQELFGAIRSALMAAGYDVYDGELPPEGTPYPFVYLADSRMSDEYGVKDIVLANVHQDIHVWHNNVRQRGTFSAILSGVKSALRGITETETYSWAIREIEQQIMQDTTTQTPLMHGVITVHYHLSGGKPC